MRPEESRCVREERRPWCTGGRLSRKQFLVQSAHFCERCPLTRNGIPLPHGCEALKYMHGPRRLEFAGGHRASLPLRVYSSTSSHMNKRASSPRLRSSCIHRLISRRPFEIVEQTGELTISRRSPLTTSTVTGVCIYAHGLAPRCQWVVRDECTGTTTVTLAPGPVARTAYQFILYVMHMTTRDTPGTDARRRRPVFVRGH